VLCDVVVDGKAESYRDTVPVTYRFSARNVRFAVIPETAGGGDVSVSLSSRHGGFDGSAPGVIGSSQGGILGGSVQFDVMSARHIANMREARQAGEPTDTDDTTD
jgi:hypothetical protein